MSKAFRCDRCGKCFVPEEETGAMITFRNPSVYDAECLRKHTVKRYREDLMCDDHLDLCPGCTIEFVLFMHNFGPVAEITDPLVEKDGV